MYPYDHPFQLPGQKMLHLCCAGANKAEKVSNQRCWKGIKNSSSVKYGTRQRMEESKKLIALRANLNIQLLIKNCIHLWSLFILHIDLVSILWRRCDAFELRRTTCWEEWLPLHCHLFLGISLMNLFMCISAKGTSYIQYFVNWNNPSHSFLCM